MPWRVKIAVAVGLVTCWMAPVVVREVVTPAAVLYTGACLFLAIVTTAVLWFRYQHRHLMEHKLISDGWAKLPGWAHREVWACPNCGAMLASMACARTHLDPESSFCAAFQELLDEQEKAALAGGARPDEGIDWSLFVQRGGAGEDTMTDDLEGIEA